MGKLLKVVQKLVTGDPAVASSKADLRMPKKRPHKKLTERELIARESEIGAKLFGDVPKGHRREFFCLDEKTWIWHEEWKDEKGVLRQATTRFEVHDNGILKVQEGARYEYIKGEELKNLVAATRLYYERIAREIYHRDPQTGQKFA